MRFSVKKGGQMNPSNEQNQHVSGKLGVLAIVALFISLSGCAFAPAMISGVAGGAVSASQAEKERSEEAAKQKPKMTQLQVRELQTRTYDNMDKNKILQVSLAVLQDDGFTVTNANTEMGLLAATKQLSEKKVDDSGTAFIKGFLGGGPISEQKFQHIEATLTVVPFGEQTRVRLSLRLAASSSRGEFNYTAVSEPEPYQDFFAKLEKGLFIKREGL